MKHSIAGWGILPVRCSWRGVAAPGASTFMGVHVSAKNGANAGLVSAHSPRPLAGEGLGVRGPGTECLLSFSFGKTTLAVFQKSRTFAPSVRPDASASSAVEGHSSVKNGVRQAHPERFLNPKRKSKSPHPSPARRGRSQYQREFPHRSCNARLPSRCWTYASMFCQ
jgi:hypothetical protein